VNVCVGFCVVAPIVPAVGSPKSQFHPVGAPVDVSVNVTGEPVVGDAGD
jgi:uracil-DNA glycosylase